MTTVVAPLSAVELMERDHENLRASAEDRIVRVAIYQFPQPSVTAGRNARVEQEQISFWNARGHAFARRPTGGGVLRHEDDISFGIAFPCVDEFVGVFYALVAAALRAALSAQNIETGFPPASSASAPDCCFAGAVGHELLYRGEKLVGLASRKIRGGVLVQGSLTVRRNPRLDRELLGVGPRVDLSEVPFDSELFADAFRGILSSIFFHTPVVSDKMF